MRRAARLSSLEDSEGGLLKSSSKSLPIDAGLLERFLEAEKGVAWKRAPAPAKPVRKKAERKGMRTKGRASSVARLASYHDETARVERRAEASEVVLTVTSGPVGALVLVAACARQGMPSSLAARNAGELRPFPDGALEARWNPKAKGRAYGLGFDDVVTLARYALA